MWVYLTSTYSALMCSIFMILKQLIPLLVIRIPFGHYMLKFSLVQNAALTIFSRIRPEYSSSSASDLSSEDSRHVNHRCDALLEWHSYKTYFNSSHRNFKTTKKRHYMSLTHSLQKYLFLSIPFSPTGTSNPAPQTQSRRQHNERRRSNTVWHVKDKRRSKTSRGGREGRETWTGASTAYRR